jgi:hypothetical protein
MSKPSSKNASPFWERSKHNKKLSAKFPTFLNTQKWLSRLEFNVTLKSKLNRGEGGM